MKKEAEDAKKEGKEAGDKKKKDAEASKKKQAEADKEIEEALAIAAAASSKNRQDIKKAQGEVVKDVGSRTKDAVDKAKEAATKAGVYGAAPAGPPVSTDDFKYKGEPFKFKDLAARWNKETKTVGKSLGSDETVTYRASDYPTMRLAPGAGLH